LFGGQAGVDWSGRELMSVNSGAHNFEKTGRVKVKGSCRGEGGGAQLIANDVQKIYVGVWMYNVYTLPEYGNDTSKGGGRVA
jgi:hypothetical protein